MQETQQTGPGFRIGGTEVPPLALGTMYFGTTVPHDAATACLDAALEVGATFWDTANNYAAAPATSPRR